MTDTTVETADPGDGDIALARRRRHRWVAVIATLVVAVGAVLVIGALNGWGQSEQHVSTFRAENQLQQLAHDSAFDMGRRMAAEGQAGNTYAGACRMFASMQGASSGTSDYYGQVSAALAGCVDGLEVFYQGE